MSEAYCFVTKEKLDSNELSSYNSINKSTLELIKKDYPNFSENDFISHKVINEYRKRYLETLIKDDDNELNAVEKEVINSISENLLLSENIEPTIEADLTYGQKIADKIAEFGGSWTFIIAFFSFLLIWMTINIIFITSKPFDPYPFILLNLILSCLAAIQAPIIMMSQNRKEQKDRIKSDYDYKINLKAELEIRLLNEKIDHMIIHQNQRLLEMQKLQLEYLDDITNKEDKLDQSSKL